MIKNRLKSLLNDLKSFKFVIILALKLQKRNKKNNKQRWNKISVFYSKAEIIIHEADIDGMLESIYSTIITNNYVQLWTKHLRFKTQASIW